MKNNLKLRRYKLLPKTESQKSDFVTVTHLAEVQVERKG